MSYVSELSCNRVVVSGFNWGDGSGLCLVSGVDMVGVEFVWPWLVLVCGFGVCWCGPVELGVVMVQ